MRTNRKLKEIIDSDDELPSSYKETTFIPAYKDDNRFNDISIYDLTKDLCGTSEESFSDILSSHESEDELNTVTKTIGKNYSILKGIISRKDAYCIKVFGSVYNDDSLLWFINYTVSQDFLSDYKFLVSCLVSDVYDCNGKEDNFKNNIKEKRQLGESKYIFEYK